MLIDPRNGPAHDTIRSSSQTRWLVLASTPRTGSTVLARLLAQTGRVGHPKEYLNPTQLRDWEVRLGHPASRLVHAALRGPAIAVVGRRPWSRAHRERHLARVARRRPGPTGWMALKVHHHHWNRFFYDEAWLPVARWVRVRRKDRLGQAISWARARQTGQWAAHRKAWSPPLYRRSAIDRALERIADAELGWDRIIANEPCLELDYQEITAQPGATVDRLLAWIGEAPAETPVSLDLERQADAISATWRARYERGG